VRFSGGTGRLLMNEGSPGHVLAIEVIPPSLNISPQCVIAGWLQPAKQPDAAQTPYLTQHG
jgi:hypothetical protein